MVRSRWIFGQMLTCPGDRPRPSILVGTLKVVLAVGGLSLLAANWIAKTGIEGGGLAHLAATTAGGYDPLTTGSLASSAADARLDPCAVPRPAGASRSNELSFSHR